MHDMHVIVSLYSVVFPPSTILVLELERMTESERESSA